MSRPTVAVLGAINVDLVVSGAPLPGPGETVVGGRFAQHHGGKGGNQAVAAARAIGDAGTVAMIGAVGTDQLGGEAVATLAAEGIDVRHVARAAGRATGVALIVVDGDGENLIAVAPGANEGVTPEAVAAALDELASSLVLASLEVPAAAVDAAGRWCGERGALFVLNPAPATEAASELVSLADVLTPNEGELDTLGGPSEGVTTVRTLGARGADIIDAGAARHVTAPAVDAVDTTGAGDCFNGVLAAGLAEGRGLDEAVGRACAAAALSVTREGARAGMPARAAIDAAAG